MVLVDTNVTMNLRIQQQEYSNNKKSKIKLHCENLLLVLSRNHAKTKIDNLSYH